MAEVVKLFVSAKAILAIQLLNVLTPKEVINANVLSTTSEIHTGKVAVIPTLAH